MTVDERTPLIPDWPCENGLVTNRQTESQKSSIGALTLALALFSESLISRGKMPGLLTDVCRHISRRCRRVLLTGHIWRGGVLLPESPQWTLAVDRLHDGLLCLATNRKSIFQYLHIRYTCKNPVNLAKKLVQIYQAEAS